MRALIWKELRENIFKVLAGIGLCAVMFAINRSDINGPSRPQIWLVAIGGISAILLGMDALAGERANKTLDYLLARPLSSVRILLAKFLVGSVGLFLIFVAFWAATYAMPLDFWSRPYIGRSLAEIGYFKMLLMWFMPFWALYALGFLCSIFADHPSKAIALGLVVAFLALIGFGALLKGVVVVAPFYGDALWTDIYDFHFLSNFDERGRLVQIARDGGLFTLKIVIWLSVVGSVFALTLFSFKRNRLFSVGWRPIVAIVSLLALASWAGSSKHSRSMRIDERDLNRAMDTIVPISYLKIKDITWMERISLNMDRRVTGDLALTRHRALITSENGLRVVDTTEPTALRLVDNLDLPHWSMRRIAATNSSVYAAGWYKNLPQDSVGVIACDIDASGKLRLRGHAGLWPLEEFRGFGQMAILGDYLYLGTADTMRMSLQVFDIGNGHLPQLIRTLPIDDIPESFSYPFNVSVFQDYKRQYKLRMYMRPPYVYVASISGLVVLDATDPSNPREVGRLDLADASEYDCGFGRAITGLGERIYLERFWPTGIAVLDIGDPRRPVEVDDLYLYTQRFEGSRTFVHQQLTGIKGYLYRNEWLGVEIIDPETYSPTGKRKLLGLDRFILSGIGDSNVEAYGDHMFALSYSGLAVYPIPTEAM